MLGATFDWMLRFFCLFFFLCGLATHVNVCLYLYYYELCLSFAASLVKVSIFRFSDRLFYLFHKYSSINECSTFPSFCLDIMCSESFSFDCCTASCISCYMYGGGREFFKRTYGSLASDIFSILSGWLGFRLWRNYNTVSLLAQGFWRSMSLRCLLVWGNRLNWGSYFCSCVNEKKKRAETSETRLSFHQR